MAKAWGDDPDPDAVQEYREQLNAKRAARKAARAAKRVERKTAQQARRG